jgi:hypothetical protein
MEFAFEERQQAIERVSVALFPPEEKRGGIGSSVGNGPL